LSHFLAGWAKRPRVPRGYDGGMQPSKDSLVEDVVARLAPKAKSLVVTVYGDAIAHRGGNAGLGSVIALLEPLGVNERTVRTSMARLAREGWLQAQAIGRRSDYRLSEAGRRRFEAAHGRLYRHTQPPWEGQWTIVAAGAVPTAAAEREHLLRDLSWLGFGRLADAVMLHPDPDPQELRALLAEHRHQVLVLRGAALEWVDERAIADVVRSGWELDRLAAGYRAFLDAFRPVWLALQREVPLEPVRGFALRTLLMHGYRRATLHDPLLPDELMPHDWPGAAARALCRNLYRHVEAAAEDHVSAVLLTAEGPAPEAGPDYFGRFGGLRRAAASPASPAATGSAPETRTAAPDAPRPPR
jgi:phenylacetic acid degradation operon negative regulatory protein